MVIMCKFVTKIIFFFLIFSLQAQNDDSHLGKHVKIVFKGGKEEFGKLQVFKKPYGKLTGHYRVVYFNTKEVESITEWDDDAPIIFDLKRNRDPKRRKLPLVMDNIKYGPITGDFSYSLAARIISREDTRNGSAKGGNGQVGESETITDIMEVEKFSPNLVHYNGIKNYWPIKMVHPQIPIVLFRQLKEAKNFNEKLRRLKFLRQSKAWGILKNKLNTMELTAEQQPLIDAEKKKLEQNILSDKKSNEIIKTMFEAKENKASGSLEVKKVLQDWWNRHAPVNHIDNLILKLKTYPEKDIKNSLRSLTPFLQSKEFSQKPGRHKIEWKTKSGEDRHYYIYLPQNYSPEKSYVTLVYLHGQISTAKGFVSWASANAEKHGFIVISPEYVYGTRWGYKYSKKEHDAIIGAVKHARTRWSINCDRTYLVGYSQGGHATFDIASSHPNFFAGVAPHIGACYYTMNMLTNHTNLPTYIVDGENDGPAPEYNRKAIQQLLKVNAPAVYVEYIDRGHDRFSEENIKLYEWMAAHPRQSWSSYVNAKFRSDFQSAVSWVQLMPGSFNGLKDPSGRGILSDKDCHIVKGSWKKNKVYIKTNRGLKALRILVPHQYKDQTNKLQIIVNGKTCFNRIIKSWDLKSYLTEVSKSKDRWIKHRQVIDIKF